VTVRSEPQTLTEREVVNSRLFDVSPEALFDAFADPARVARWWGPNGFTNTVHEFDLRPGRRWRLTMHAPDGTDYENESVFVEIDRPRRVVLDHLEPIHRFRMTMDFDGRDGRTRLTWRMLFDSADEFARVGSFCAAANEQNFDRLAAELA